MSKPAAKRRKTSSPANGGGRGGGGSAQAAGSMDVATVLSGVRRLVSELSVPQLSAQTLSRLGDCREVRVQDEEMVMKELERIIVSLACDIVDGKGLDLLVPSRNKSNQHYVEELDRMVLGDKVSVRSFFNTSHTRKTAITVRAMDLIHEVLSRRIHITKRDLFYTDVKLFRDQTESDAVLDDIACMAGCTRSSLNVVASNKGLVVGRLTFSEAGDEIDCTRMGISGKAIPPFNDRIAGITSDAEFILLVEKEAVFLRLSEDRFYNKYPCIIVTGKGQPDVATRQFLRRLKLELSLPVFALFDADPYGLKILSVYTSGSKAMSYDSSSLTTDDIKWLGILPTDFETFNLPSAVRLPMTAADIKTGEELLEEDYIHPAWREELQIMLKTKTKAEIQALAAFGFQFISEVYLPQKLANSDWL